MNNIETQTIKINILCEGVAEKRYIERLNILYGEKINIVCHGNDGNSGNVKKMKEKAKRIYEDNIFFCYDVDGNKTKCELNNDKHLISNRQFEYWLQLHLDKNDTESAHKIYTDIEKRELRKQMDNMFKNGLDTIKEICKIEKTRQQNGIKYENNFSTFYRLIDFIENMV